MISWIWIIPVILATAVLVCAVMAIAVAGSAADDYTDAYREGYLAAMRDAKEDAWQ